MNLPYALRDAITAHPLRAAEDDELWATIEFAQQLLANVRFEQERRRLNRSTHDLH